MGLLDGMTPVHGGKEDRENKTIQVFILTGGQSLPCGHPSIMILESDGEAD
jgi:hypothetical protein